MTLDGGDPGRELTRCWRCGRDVSRTVEACPHCAAPRRRGVRRPSIDSSRKDAGRLPGVLVVFGILLAISVLHVILVSSGAKPDAAPAALVRRQLAGLLAFELLTTAVIVAGIRILGRPSRWPPVNTGSTLAAWGLSVVGLLLMVRLNTGYHELLQQQLGPAPIDAATAAALRGSALAYLVLCFQPAVVEEIFFRWLTLDSLREAMGVPAAVLTSSLMFGIAHIGMPLSIPILMVLGVLLGLARVATGSLVLPIALHFFHNLVLLVQG